MLSVPYQSQGSDDVPEEWRAHACSIANVKMAIEALRGSAPSMRELIEEGESMQGFGPRGWTHDAIVFLLHNHGVSAYREEFRSRDAAVAEVFAHEGAQKIAAHIVAGAPVIASLQKENGSYHTVLLIDTDEDGFVAHDPEVGPEQKISRDAFLKQWKRLAIFPYRHA